MKKPTTPSPSGAPRRAGKTASPQTAAPPPDGAAAGRFVPGCGAYGVRGAAFVQRAEQLLYPRKYEQLVEKWAAAYELDPLLVYAFIRTESGFDPQATSSVDARGLMQMTEETFLWMRSKIAPEEPLTFADLYDPDTAIRFGCYYLHLCMVRYKGDVSTAAAAYHSGWGTVDQLLQIEEHSADGETLQGFPYNQMHHYVNKITACYQTYQRLYAGQ